jgi:hypothetical protein
MPQHGNDEIEMVGVQAGHETAHTCSADLSRPAGFATEWHRSGDVSAVRQQVPGLVDTESEELSRRSSPCAIGGSPSAKRCLSKETPDAREGFCRVDTHRVLVQSNLLRVIEPETTTGRSTRTYLWKTA